MRGMDEMQELLFATVRLEDFVPADHPQRLVQLLVNRALKRINGLFSTIYADRGRASIAPEKLACTAAGAVLGAQRTHADGADALQTRCFAGSPSWPSKTRCGTIRCSRRTGTGCLNTKWSRRSLRRSCVWPTVRACCRGNTFRWTVR